MRFGFESSETETEEEIERTRIVEETCVQYGFHQHKTTFNKSLLATVDQSEWMKDNFSNFFLDVVFWIHLTANIICLNVTFLSEVFFMVMVSIIFHAFSFIHKQIDGLLGNPDSIFNINVVHEPVDTAETEADHIVRKELKEAKVNKLPVGQKTTNRKYPHLGILSPIGYIIPNWVYYPRLFKLSPTGYIIPDWG